MRHDVASRLLRGVGASAPFVDDVLGDLEELAAERRDAGQPCGRRWYAGQVIRTLPYALKDSVRGSAVGSLVDASQKALSAWLLVGAAALVVAVALIEWSGSATTLRHWMLSQAFVVLLLLAITLRFALLGYVAAWIDSKRPLLTLFAAAAFDASLVYLLPSDGLTIAQRLIMPSVVWCLVMLGGTWRVLRAPLPERQASPLVEQPVQG